jgi:hypothetical protein
MVSLIENLDAGFVRLLADSKVLDTLELVRHCWGYWKFLLYTHDCRVLIVEDASKCLEFKQNNS